MAWQDYMTTLVRNLIDDVLDPQQYTDSRIEEAIVAAAQLMSHEVTFLNTFTINLSTLSISPDPTVVLDHAFINLTCLRTACIMLHAIYKNQARMSGITVKDAEATITTTGNLVGYEKMWKKACQDYDQALWEYKSGIMIPGVAILGPFASATFSFQNRQ